MPTSRRRIGVVLDPELSSALAIARPHLRGGSEAARLRELALVGAASLQARDPDAAALADTDRLLASLGARPATSDLVETSRELTGSRTAPSAGSEGAAQSLAWIRGNDRDH